MESGLSPERYYRRNNDSLSAPLRFLPTTGSNFTQFRKLVPMDIRTQTCELLFGTFILAEVVPKMLEVAIREKFFRLLRNRKKSVVWAAGRQDSTPLHA
jgi:hypothetical protein